MKGDITKEKLLQVTSIFIILIVRTDSKVYTYVKTYQTVHSEYVQYIIYRVYLNKGIFFKDYPVS